jgi:hypothetical protein
MGRRSRKRPAAPDATATAPAPAPQRPVRPVQSTAARRPGQSRIDRFIERADERPKPPWHPWPLVELAVLVGLALIVIGLINSDTSRGRLAMLFGLALASLAGLDTAAREHFAGFRSHSALLGGMPAVVVVAVLGLAGLPVAVVAAAGLLAFGAGFWAFRTAFRRRAGVPFKV